MSLNVVLTYLDYASTTISLYVDKKDQIIYIHIHSPDARTSIIRPVFCTVQ